MKTALSFGLLAILAGTLYTSLKTPTAFSKSENLLRPLSTQALEYRAPTSAMTDMRPWASERLASPIKLDQCPGVEIIEWRSPGPTIDKIKALNKTCADVIKNLPKFLKSSINLDGFHQTVCLMPSKNLAGENIRNLNDYQYRFKNREKVYKNNKNKPIPIFGYTSFANDIIFLGSDLGDSTNLVFAHELFHAIADFNNLEIASDEKYAKDFTQYLHLGR